MDLSNYATKGHLKGATGINISTFTSKIDLTSLKTKLDNLDIDKLRSVLVDLNKLRAVMDNDAVKKTVYNNLLTKVNAIDSRTATLLD